MSYFEDRIAAILADRSLVKDVPVKKLAARREPADGYIYFVRMGTFVKIGFTTDVAARMKAARKNFFDGLFELEPS